MTDLALLQEVVEQKPRDDSASAAVVAVALVAAAAATDGCLRVVATAFRRRHTTAGRQCPPR